MAARTLDSSGGGRPRKECRARREASSAFGGRATETFLWVHKVSDEAFEAASRRMKKEVPPFYRRRASTWGRAGRVKPASGWQRAVRSVRNQALAGTHLALLGLAVEAGLGLVVRDVLQPNEKTWELRQTCLTVSLGLGNNEQERPPPASQQRKRGACEGGRELIGSASCRVLRTKVRCRTALRRPARAYQP
jgi:hypothetical protein